MVKLVKKLIGCILKEWKEHLKKHYEEILSAADIPKCQKICNEIEELTGIKIDFPTIKKQ